MSPLLILPTPLSSKSVALGQLTTYPIHTEILSFDPSSRPDCNPSSVSSNYQSIITHDEYSRFVSSTSEQNPRAHHDTIILNAEQSAQTSLAQPRLAFDALRNDLAAQSYFRKSALQNQSLYYVTGLQTLKNPSFQRAGSETDRIAEASAAEIRMPMHVRRVDSAFGLDTTKSEESKDEETILAVELMKVRCHVGPASEPHGVEDTEYEWSYHSLDDGDLQLSIGLGKALEASELRAIAGMEEEEEEEGEEEIRGRRWVEQYEDDDDGIGGF